MTDVAQEQQASCRDRAGRIRAESGPASRCIPMRLLPQARPDARDMGALPACRVRPSVRRARPRSGAQAAPRAVAALAPTPVVRPSAWEAVRACRARADPRSATRNADAVGDGVCSSPGPLDSAAQRLFLPRPRRSTDRRERAARATGESWRRSSSESGTVFADKRAPSSPASGDRTADRFAEWRPVRCRHPCASCWRAVQDIGSQRHAGPPTSLSFGHGCALYFAL